MITPIDWTRAHRRSTIERNTHLYRLIDRLIAEQNRTFTHAYSCLLMLTHLGRTHGRTGHGTSEEREVGKLVPAGGGTIDDDYPDDPDNTDSSGRESRCGGERLIDGLENGRWSPDIVWRAAVWRAGRGPAWFHRPWQVEMDATTTRRPGRPTLHGHAYGMDGRRSPWEMANIIIHQVRCRQAVVVRQGDSRCDGLDMYYRRGEAGRRLQNSSRSTRKSTRWGKAIGRYRCGLLHQPSSMGDIRRCGAADLVWAGAMTCSC